MLASCHIKFIDCDLAGATLHGNDRIWASYSAGWKSNTIVLWACIPQLVWCGVAVFKLRHSRFLHSLYSKICCIIDISGCAESGMMTYPSYIALVLINCITRGRIFSNLCALTWKMACRSIGDWFDPISSFFFLTLVKFQSFVTHFIEMFLYLTGTHLKKLSAFYDSKLQFITIHSS